MDRAVRKRRSVNAPDIFRRMKCAAAIAMLSLLLLTQTALADTRQSLDALAQDFGGSFDTLLTSEQIVPGDAVSDWIALVSGRCGGDGSDYLQRLETYVSECYAQQGGLDRVKPTEWHRISLTVLALGGDPTSFGTDEDGHPVDLIADGTYNWHTTDSPGIQGLNAWIYALLTLDAKAYAVPEDALYPRHAIVQAILGAQEPDGSFGLNRGHGNVDITAMALQALAPYANGTPRYAVPNGAEITVGDAITRALNWLHTQQLPDGSFANSCSTAQVVLALCDLGIPPSDFSRDGHSAAEGLLSFLISDGLFRYLPADEDHDIMSTEQGILALSAMERLDKGQRRIFDYRAEMEDSLQQEIRSLNEELSLLTENTPAQQVESLYGRYQALPSAERSYVFAYSHLKAALERTGLPLIDDDPAAAYNLTPPTRAQDAEQSTLHPWIFVVAGVAAAIAIGAVVLRKKGAKHHV